MQIGELYVVLFQSVLIEAYLIGAYRTNKGEEFLIFETKVGNQILCRPANNFRR